MPIYEYECHSCGRRHEIMQRYSDLPLTICPACGGMMKKLISNTSFVLKGTGWYKTDYASTKQASGGEKGNGSGQGKKPEAETKPDTSPKTE